MKTAASFVQAKIVPLARTDKDHLLGTGLDSDPFEEIFALSLNLYCLFLSKKVFVVFRSKTAGSNTFRFATKLLFIFAISPLVCSGKNTFDRSLDEVNEKTVIVLGFAQNTSG